MKRSIWQCLLAAWVAVWCIGPAALRAQGGATVRPEPAALEVGVGQEETLQIVLEDAQDAYGIDVRARFDPAVIEVADADPAKEGVQMIPGQFIKPDFLVRNGAENITGTLQYVTTQVNPTPPVSGRGVVLSLLIRGKSLGRQSAFTIDFVEIADRTGRKLPVRGQASTVTVVQPKPPTPTPTARATATASPTPTMPATATGAVVAQAVTPTAGASPLPTAPADEAPLDPALLAVAIGGGLGALVLVIIALILLRRPRARGDSESKPQG